MKRQSSDWLYWNTASGHRFTLTFRPLECRKAAEICGLLRRAFRSFVAWAMHLCTCSRTGPWDLSRMMLGLYKVPLTNIRPTEWYFGLQCHCLEIRKQTKLTCIPFGILFAVIFRSVLCFCSCCVPSRLTLKQKFPSWRAQKNRCLFLVICYFWRFIGCLPSSAV